MNQSGGGIVTSFVTGLRGRNQPAVARFKFVSTAARLPIGRHGRKDSRHTDPSVVDLPTHQRQFNLFLYQGHAQANEAFESYSDPLSFRAAALTGVDLWIIPREGKSFAFSRYNYLRSSDRTVARIARSILGRELPVGALGGVPARVLEILSADIHSKYH
jgi:hypothetical protein